MSYLNQIRGTHNYPFAAFVIRNAFHKTFRDDFLFKFKFIHWLVGTSLYYLCSGLLPRLHHQFRLRYRLISKHIWEYCLLYWGMK